MVFNASALTLLNALQEEGERGRRGVGGTSGLGKAGEGQAAGESLEGPEEGLGTPRLGGGEEASVCTGEETLWPSPEVGSLLLCAFSLSPAPDSPRSSPFSSSLR